MSTFKVADVKLAASLLGTIQRSEYINPLIHGQAEAHSHKDSQVVMVNFDRRDEAKGTS